MSRVGKRSSGKKFSSKTLKCVACSLNRDAEIVHLELRVPICGACDVSCKQRDVLIRESNQESCVMCGTGDDNELMMCDSCPKSFCSLCIERNFGSNELRMVRDAQVWECYLCSMSSLFAKLQVDETTVFYSLDSSYAEIKPPPQLPSILELVSSFSPGEAMFASIFSNEVSNTIFSDVDIVGFLAGPDISPKLFSLSKKLRLFFQMRNIVLPGLFRTEYGKENLCRLHPHQVVSLNKLTQIENRNQYFGALRGGVFADEPGLGKTVTALALVSSTAGRLPSCPSLFWDEAKINESWAHLKTQHETLLAPILNKLRKFHALDYKRVEEEYECIKKHLRAGLYSLSELISAMRHFIRAAAICPSSRDHCISVFNFGMLYLLPSSFFLFLPSNVVVSFIMEIEMNGLKERLDSSRRKSLSAVNSRAMYERRLLPSAATLIIVPLALLEHWYEQIMRHLQLTYFLHPEGRSTMRGVVYLDGLGDIVDVEAPLSKVLLRPSVPIQAAEFLSSYMIVVTTLERCASEHRALGQDEDFVFDRKSLSKIDKEVASSNFRGKSSLASRSPLMQLRWLRMIVDEGHEISRSANDPSNTRCSIQAGEMISQIAAERRWIMSGTPTTGAHSDVGLYQLFHILSLLRHPLYTDMDGQHTTVKWKKEIVEPCLMQLPSAWDNVKEVLREIMVRHTKQDIHLFAPIHMTVNLEGMPDPSDPVEEARMLRVDRSKAYYIAETIRSCLKTYKATVNTSSYRTVAAKRSLSRYTAGQSLNELDKRQQQMLFNARRPKAIVFSQHWSDLQGVGHFLYMMLGENHVCEHTGAFQSAELSRFRHSKRKYRVCPMCGHRNLITSAMECDKVLLLVEYIDVPPAMNNVIGADGGTALAFAEDMRPYPSGHGRFSWGGHYRGRCLCSAEGCNLPCSGLPNPFYTLRFAQNTPVSSHLAIISEEHVLNYQPGLRPAIGSEVFVTSCDPVTDVETIASVADAPIPKLWYGGRRGGRAIVRQWRRCGGRNMFHSWHGNRILPSAPWTIEEEDASILLLQHEGSTGLDLSFATHIFLLERISDPALRNQLISRAHRVGAQGPVTVALLQVVATEDEPAEKS